MRRPTRAPSKQFAVLLFLFTLTIFYGCLDDEKDKEIPTSTVQFIASSLSVTEGNETIVYLALDRAAFSDGSVVVRVETSAAYNQHFFIDPAINGQSLTLPILKGQTMAQFKVSTVDNALFDKSKSINFTLTVPTTGLKLGYNTTFRLTIEDDEGPSIANFEKRAGVVEETNGDGIEVKIQLSSPAKGQGGIEIYFISELAIYGTHFTTSPIVTNNLIALDISQDQSSVVFKVFPVNNTLYTDSLMVTFSIAYVDGVVEKGDNTTYSLTIVDDEKPSLLNFANASGEVNENSAEGLTVEIPFSDPAPEPGTIRISLASTGIYGQDFITEPAGFGGILILKVNKNQSSASFKVMPLDNSYSNYYTAVQFALSVVDGPLKAGNEINYTVTIIDNEIVEASFAEGTGSIAENNTTGIVVKIDFSKPLSQLTQLIVKGPDEQNKALYGVIYSTSPEMTAYNAYSCGCDDCYYCSDAYYINHQIIMLVQKGATSVEFAIIPIDNAKHDGNSNITFSLLSYYESPLLIEDGEFTLTLVDND